VAPPSKEVILEVGGHDGLAGPNSVAVLLFCRTGTQGFSNDLKLHRLPFVHYLAHSIDIIGTEFMATSVRQQWQYPIQ
jgi:hypothetical protein